MKKNCASSWLFRKISVQFKEDLVVTVLSFAWIRQLMRIHFSPEDEGTSPSKLWEPVSKRQNVTGQKI